MTLAKTCHASNMMLDLVKPTYSLLQPQRLSESRWFNVALLCWQKIEYHFETKSSDAQRI